MAVSDDDDGVTNSRSRSRFCCVPVASVLTLTLAACGADTDADPTLARPSGSDGAVVTAAPGEPTEADGEQSSGSPLPDDDGPSPEALDGAGSTVAAAGVPEVLDFTAATVDGGAFDGADLAGRPVLLWFWAPWCTVCAREAPSVAQLADDLQGQVEVVGVAGLSSDASAMAAFVERGGVEDLVHVADTDGSVYSRFGVASQYDSVTVSADGEVTVLTGPLSEAQLREAAERLVG